MEEAENNKLEKISAISATLLELKKRHGRLAEEKENLMREKFLKLKRSRLEEYRQKAADMDEKEKELCRKTNELLDDLIQTCDDTPFQRALVEILGNLRGKIS